MLTLAIDTSTKTASVALLRYDSILAECLINVSINHSVTLLPMIENILSTACVKIGEVDLFALTVGPGSFTGLRISAGAVKGLALATGKPVVGVCTVDALALNLADSAIIICPMLDAGRREVYTALYRPRRSGIPEKITGERVVGPEEFLKEVDEDVIFLGDGSTKYAKLIREILPDKSYFASPQLQYVRAFAVGLLGMKKFRKGDTLDLITLTPQYLRLSEAEIKRGSQVA